MIKKINISNAEVRPNSRETELLHKHFAQCFNNEGKFDLSKFEALISDKVDLIKENQGFDFLGKSYARMLASMETTTVIIPDEEHNSKPENVNSQNIYISGDNLDALKHLVKSYAGKVKCIYIDPPYNTGEDGFVYNDSFKFTKEELVEKLSVSEEQAERIIGYNDGDTRSDASWLTFMLPRLQLAKDLLAENGLIFISIDENEQANLKLLCDEIFGLENNIANIIIQSNKRGRTYQRIAQTHEYLLVYAKYADVKINELEKNEDSNSLEDAISKFEERELRNRNPKFGRFNRPNLYYPIYVNPNKIDEIGYYPVSLEKSDEFSVEIWPLNSEGEESCWRWGEQKFKRNNDANTMESNVVARKKTTGAFGCYEKYRKGTFKAKTIWYEDEFVDDIAEEDDDIWDENFVITEKGTKELKALGMAGMFDFPKPTGLIKKLLNIGSDEDSLIVDFFSGSGSTSDAIMQLNSILGEKGNRRYIVVQLPENLDEKLRQAPSGQKAKVQSVIDFLEKHNYPHTLDYVGVERIKRVAKRLKDENPSIQIDFGFKHYTLQELPEDTVDKIDEFQPILLPENNEMLGMMGGKEAVLTTWLNSDGYGMNCKAEDVKLAQYTAYHKDDHLYLLDGGFDEDAMAALIEKYDKDPVGFHPSNIVLFGYCLSLSESLMLKKSITAIRNNEKGNSINIIERF